MSVLKHRHRATRLCIEAAQNLMKACGGDLQFEGPGWNSCTVDMIRVAKAHSQLVLHQTFVEAVAKLQRSVCPFHACILILPLLPNEDMHHMC